MPATFQADASHHLMASSAVEIYTHQTQESKQLENTQPCVDALNPRQNLPRSTPGQGQSSTIQHRLLGQITLLEPSKDKLDSLHDTSLEYRTGYAVALQTMAIASAKQESPPPLLLSFSDVALQGARDAAPHIDRVLNLAKSKFGNDWLERAQALGCVAIDLGLKLLTPEVIEKSHQGGLRVMCYTPNDPALIAKFFSWGIDSVITDMIHSIDPAAYQRWGQSNNGSQAARYSTLPDWPYAPVAGHRLTGKTTGDYRMAPENTMAGAVAAFGQHYTAVEYDVNISTDPVPVPFVMHDERLERTTNGTGTVSRPWSELATLQAGVNHSEKYATEPIPTDLELAHYLIDHQIARFVEIKPTTSD